MSTHKYAWFLAFDDTKTYDAVAQMLLDSGDLDGEWVNFLCPDGRKRHVIQCSYNHIVQVQESDARMGRRNKFKFYVMRKRLPDSAVEFWPPNWKSAYLRALSHPQLKDAAIITGTELLKKREESSELKKPKPSSTEDDPPPF